MKKHDAALIIASSESSPDLYYATRMFVPDPFIYFERNGKKTVVMSDLEVDRAKAQAKVDEVLSASRLMEQLKRSGVRTPSMMDLVDAVFKKRRVKRVLVPAGFPVRFADLLRERGYQVAAKPDPFFEQRMVKDEREIAAIREVQQSTERAVLKAVELIRSSKVQNGKLFVEGKPLTSEAVKKTINLSLMEDDCVAQHTIVASGPQCVDPHNTGSGPILAGTSIILDVFPKSGRTGYYADMTRTVCRGRASDALKKLFDAVLQGQELGLSLMRDGCDGSEVHGAIVKRFEKLGYKSGLINGRMQGFFHGTGHGVGLEIHEPPRVSAARDILKAGEVVTCEPGLYYEGVGGVRLEDLVVIRKSGCENLTTFPKFLELA